VLRREIEKQLSYLNQQLQDAQASPHKPSTARVMAMMKRMLTDLDMRLRQRIEIAKLPNVPTNSTSSKDVHHQQQQQLVSKASK
jgi:hypothetical protein